MGGVDPLFVLRGHYSDVSALAAHPQRDELLASGDADGFFKLWDLNCRRTIISERISVCGVIGIAFPFSSPQVFYTQGRDGVIKMWDLEASVNNSSLLTNGSSHEASTGSFSFCRISVPRPVSSHSAIDAPSKPPGSAGSDTCATSPSDSTVAPSGNLSQLVGACSDTTGVFDIWDMRAGTRAASFGGSSTKSMGLVMCLQLLQGILASAADIIAFAGYESGHVASWDWRQPGNPLTSTKIHNEPVTCLALNSRGDGAICGSTENSIRFLSTTMCPPSITEVHKQSLPKPGTSDVAVRLDDKICAVACCDHRIRIFNFHTSQPLAVARLHSADVSQVLFSQNHFLYASSRDGTISAWNFYPPKVVV